MLRLDINCDMGESTHLHYYHISDDLKLFPYLSSVNIACGAHAGDAHTMRTLIMEAVKSGLAIGAHPSYEDRNNFGRTAINISLEEVYKMVSTQLNAIIDILTGMGKRLDHVKPHGALYNSAAKDPELANVICRAIAEAGKDILLYGLAGSCMKHAAVKHGLRFISEVFADRSYQDDGSLTPRNLPGALLENAAKCRKQLIDMALHARVRTITGNCFSLKVESICLHSDGAHALEFARLVHETLTHHGVAIARPS